MPHWLNFLSQKSGLIEFEKVNPITWALIFRFCAIQDIPKIQSTCKLFHQLLSEKEYDTIIWYAQFVARFDTELKYPEKNWHDSLKLLYTRYFNIPNTYKQNYTLNPTKRRLEKENGSWDWAYVNGEMRFGTHSIQIALLRCKTQSNPWKFMLGILPKSAYLPDTPQFSSKTDPYAPFEAGYSITASGHGVHNWKNDYSHQTPNLGKKIWDEEIKEGSVVTLLLDWNHPQALDGVAFCAKVNEGEMKLVWVVPKDTYYFCVGLVEKNFAVEIV